MKQAVAAVLIPVFTAITAFPLSYAAEPLLNTGQNLTPVKSLSAAPAPSSVTKTQGQVPSLAQMDQPLTKATTAAAASRNITGGVYNPALLTVLQGNPTVYASKHDDDNDASLTLTQTSNREFSVNYALQDASDFAFAWIDFQLPKNMGSQITLALNGPLGKQLKVEFRDASGNAAVFYALLGGTKQNYNFALSGSNVPPGFNYAQLQSVSFVADQAVSASSGSFTVETRGLNYVPVLNGSTYNPSSITNLPGQPSLFSGKSSFSNAVIVPGQVNSTNFGFGFWMPSNSDYVYSGIRLSSPSYLGPSATFALSGPAGKKLKVEFKDAFGKVAASYVNLTDEMKNYTFLLTPDVVPVNFDVTKIQEIVIVAEKFAIGESGSVQAEVRGLLPPSVPTVAPAPAVSVWQGLPSGGIPISVFSAPASSSMTAVSPTNAVLTYNTSAVGWAGGGYLYDNPATPALETISFAGQSYLMFGIKGEPAIVKVELMDSLGRKSSVYLTSIRNDREEIYAIPLTVFTNIDLLHIKAVFLIVEGRKTGTVEIATRKDTIRVFSRDSSGYITNAEVVLKDGRVYRITSAGNTVTVTRYNSYNGTAVESYPLYNTKLNQLRFIPTQNPDPFLYLEKETVQSNGTRKADPGILALPQAARMIRPYVPAPSNPNYAFYDDPSFTIFCAQNNLYHCGGELALVDLRTGRIQHLASNSDQPLGNTYTKAYDVTPDGQNIIFEVGVKNYVQGNKYWAVLQSMNNSNKKIFTPAGSYAAPMQSFVFMNYGPLFVTIRFKDKNGVERYILFDLTLLTATVRNQ